MLPRRTLAAFAALLLLLGAACGDDGSSEASGQTATSADTDDTPEETDDSRADSFDEDIQVAEAAVLTLDDLPVGWSSKPRDEEDDSGDDEFDQQIADCMDVPVEEIADSNNPKAESETFVADDDTEVEAEVIVAPTVDEAVEDFDMATAPEFLECMREVLPALMADAADEEGSEFTLTDASIGPLRIEEAGERSAAFRLTISIEVEGFSVEIYADLLVAQVGRATMQVTTTSAFTTPDVRFSQSLLEAMVDRIDVGAVS